MGYLSTTNPSPLYGFTVQTMQVTTGTPETVVNDQTQQNPLGSLMRWNDNVYRYAQFSTGVGAVAGAAAGVTYWKTLTIGVASTTSPTWLATSDQSDGMCGGSLSVVAGIMKGVVTTLYYTFLQVAGTATCTVVSTTAIGDGLIGSATDLTFGRIALGSCAPGSTVYGQAITAYSAGTATVFLDGRSLIW